MASKALSGIGQPVAIILYDERLDVWAPGAHTGTFRGNQVAFAAGAEAVRIVRRDDVLGNVRARAAQIAAPPRRAAHAPVGARRPRPRASCGGSSWPIRSTAARPVRWPSGCRRAAWQRVDRGARRPGRLRRADAAAAQRRRRGRRHRRCTILLDAVERCAPSPCSAAAPVTAMGASGPATTMVVWKFGGTSVADPARLRAVAERLIAAQRAGHRVVAVLSAMGARPTSSSPSPGQCRRGRALRELDALLAVGEAVSCALAAMAVDELGSHAVSFTGVQAGIFTDDRHGNARLREIRPLRVLEELDTGAIVLVTGFQGISPCGDVTTLGRGGSDASAVALAAALGLRECQIFTDVDGVFTADPRVVPEARKLPAIGWAEMLHLAAAGAAVLQPRAVELAIAHDIDIHVRSSFTGAPGTWIMEEASMFETDDVVGVAHRDRESCYAVRGLSPAAISAALAERGSAVGTVVRHGAEVLFTAPGLGRDRGRRRARTYGRRGRGPGRVRHRDRGGPRARPQARRRGPRAARPGARRDRPAPGHQHARRRVLPRSRLRGSAPRSGCCTTCSPWRAPPSMQWPSRATSRGSRAGRSDDSTPRHRGVSSVDLRVSHTGPRSGRALRRQPPSRICVERDGGEPAAVLRGSLRPDAGRVAVEVGPVHLTYTALDRRANQLAHLLRERGVATESPVGILLGRSEETYVALLGVMKAGAAYVPLDPSFPPDRLAFIAEDSGFRTLVTTTTFRDATRELPGAVLELDDATADLARQPTRRPDVDIDPEGVCYVIYTSGSTGKPKGVAISHASIVNFLRVATPIYGVTADDRVYQGMSISFDFHLEEMWPAWVAGATLVAGPTDARRFGRELTDFLVRNRVTVFCAVPTLLTTIDGDPGTVRCLLVSGEPMPADLVRRWSRPGRRILNCYGPTETTVSSSCCELLPDRPVTLGRPFPTYTFYVLDENLRQVPDGEVGEICIGGPGTGLGYLNLKELTAERFIPNPVDADRAAVPRIYRTGDLGRSTPSGEYEYLGRIDTQVKIRGYRIELGEIEQVIREDDAVENAVVTHGRAGRCCRTSSGTSRCAACSPRSRRRRCVSACTRRCGAGCRRTWFRRSSRSSTPSRCSPRTR